MNMCFNSYVLTVICSTFPKRGGQVLQGDDSNFGNFIEREGFDFLQVALRRKKIVILFHLKIRNIRLVVGL